MSPRIFVLGIDGATFDVILPMVREGILPHLGSLLEEGYRSPLKSTIHPITAAAWTSFATGTHPGRHGIFDFETAEPGSYRFRLNSARDRRGIPFWVHLERAGLRSLVVNVPFTYPPDRLQGGMISGFDAPGATRDMASPPELFDELTERFGEYTPDWTFPAGQRFEAAAYRRSVEETVRRRTESTLYLMENRPWDLFVAVYGSVDHVQHLFFGPGEEGREEIRRAYALVDDGLGQILARLAPEDTVMVMSDHGFGHIEKVVYLDRWLEREGFLRFLAPWSPGRVRHHSLSFLRRLLKRLLPPRVRGILRGRMPGLRDAIASHGARPPIDWGRTQAYSGGMYGNIYINRKGQRPRGTVGESEYEEVCRRIADRLEALRDPESGEAVVERVHRREDLYHGANLESAPDLLVQWRDYAYYAHHGLDEGGNIFGESLRIDSSDAPHRGTHRLHGVFAARGPQIAPGVAGGGASIVDLAPTILHLFGLSVPAEMEGRVLEEIFLPEWMGTHPVRRDHSGEGGGEELAGGRPPTPEEQKQLEERLRSLGYL